MPVINFPDNPTVGDQYTYGTYTWEWSGLAWKAVTTTAVDASPFIPENSSDWNTSPSSIGEALNELASRLRSLEG